MKYIVLILAALVVTGCSSTPEQRPAATHYDTDFNNREFNRPRDGRQNDGYDTVVEMEDGTLVRVDATTRAEKEELERLLRSERDMAYEDGVRDTMEEMSGRMRARQGFIWQEPIYERVWMPGEIRNGAFVPGHFELVQVSPGRWIEANGVALPEEDMSAAPRESERNNRYDDGR